MNINEIIINSMNRNASDIHVVCGLPVRIRIHGELTDYDEHVLTHEDCEEIAFALAGEDYKQIEEIGELDFARSIPVGDGSLRTRVNVFRQQGHASAAIRILMGRIPQLEKLGLPDSVAGFVNYQRGIVLVTGETGSGKSTTLAALLDKINHSRKEHIITLEDPVEYIYTPDLCTVNQREIGRDTKSYDDGLRAALREDPDVILIGEMRGLDTIETAITAAETGHLVFATLHTNSASDAVERIVNVFPGEKQQQIRLQLSLTLKAVLSQQLLPKKSGTGRALACEVMIVNSAIRNLIREGKTPQINNTIQTSMAEGSMTMDTALVKLVQSGDITPEVALNASFDQDSIRARLGLGGGPGAGIGGMGNAGMGAGSRGATAGRPGQAPAQRGLFR
ncbi:MAG: type IV pilus twitching motility protein PilT [Eubacteriales bacterium]|nr:type IV pilus twitching motility protein PilT [Eubacteriales bacterium]